MKHTELGVSWKLYIIGFGLGCVGLTSKYMVIRMESCIDLEYNHFMFYLLLHVYNQLAEIVTTTTACTNIQHITLSWVSIPHVWPPNYHSKP